MGVNLLRLGFILAAFFPPLACQGRQKKSSSVLNYFGGFISDQVIRWKRDSAASVRNWQFLLSFSLTDGLVWGGVGTNSETKRGAKEISISCRNQPTSFRALLQPQESTFYIKCALDRGGRAVCKVKA